MYIDVYMSGPIARWVSGKFMFHNLATIDWKPLLSFRPSMSLHSRKQGWLIPEGDPTWESADASCNAQFTDPHTTLEGVGKSNIGSWLVERCLGCHCQCEYYFSLVSFLVLTFQLVWSLLPRDLRFMGLSVTISKWRTAQQMQLSVSTKWTANWQGRQTCVASRWNGL